MLGYQNGQEVLGKTDYDFLDKKQANQIRKNDSKVIKAGKTLTFEEKVSLPNGASAIYLTRKTPLFDAKGKNIGILGVSTDITEDKKRAEHELLEIKSNAEKKEKGVKNYYEHLIVLMPGNVYWMDRNNVFLGCNDQQAKLAGLKSRYEIIGKTNYDMPWKEQADALNALNNKVMEAGIPYTEEEDAEMVYGKEIKKGVFLSQKIPLFDDAGKVVVELFL